MKPQQLRGRKTCDFIQRKGSMWKGKTFRIRYVYGAPKNRPGKEGVFLGTYASSSLHKSAVKRNRMRRRCREAMRIALQQTENVPTIQLLLTPRSSSLTCDYADIVTDVEAFLSTLSAS